MTNALLSRRERQLLEILYRRGEATITEIMSELDEDIGGSSVSKFLWLLEQRKLITHSRLGRKNVYRPAKAPEEASAGAIASLTTTFFGGSALQAVSALLNQSKDELSSEEIDQLYSLIKAFKEKTESGS